MKNDKLKQFVNLRESLRAEQVMLEKRLAEIQAALADRAVTTPATTAAPRARKARRARNIVSLKAAILQATREKALTKPEILAAVQKAGYQFTTAKPMNSINVVLYGKQPKFKKANGKFRPMS